MFNENDDIQEKYRKLKERLEKIKADEIEKKKNKFRRYDAAAHRKKYKLKKKKKEAEQRKELRKEKRKTTPYWRIILTSHRKIMVNVLQTPKKEDAIQKFNKILIENQKSVRIPTKHIVVDGVLKKANYELLLLKERLGDEPMETLLRDDIGKLTPIKTNKETWVVYNKADFLFEETYWVYGFSPIHDRKNFNYIHDILVQNTTKTKIHEKRVIVLYNKLIIEDENYDFDLVICKTQDDCIRLYNELQNDCDSNGIKSIYFSGMAKVSMKDILVERIKLKTGWNKDKITRKTTRKYKDCKF